MAEPTATSNFHLNYDPEEDRLLVSVDLPDGKEYAMAMTRRLAKLLVGALADMHASRRAKALGSHQQMRDTVLSFEHERAVAEGFSSGGTRSNLPKKPLFAPPRLVREVKLTPRDDGGTTMVLDDKARALTFDLNQPRLHSFMAGVLDLAAHAHWDLPVIAAWLERADAGDAAPKVVH
ncbi:MAG TPA: hypothetical protein VN802_02140 [Stellaceae bacterium]|nr:hypothetical protein [Stellaceae bacterium]